MKKFVFLHIPKTAGVSIFHTLKDLIFDLQGKWPHIPKTCSKSVFFGHIPAWTLIQDGYIERGYFDDAIIFYCTRNAWERAASLYFYFDQERKGISFESFLRTIPRDHTTYSHSREQTFWLRDLPPMIPMEFGPNLQTQFQAICELIEIEHRQLQYRNANKNYSMIPAELYAMNPGTQALVVDIYASDIERFGQIFPY